MVALRRPCLHLIGFIAGCCCLVWLGRRQTCCGLVVAARYSRLRRFDIGFGGFSLRLSSLVQFVAEFVLCFLKLLYRLAHSAGEFRQFLCSEQNQNNQQDDDQVRPCQVHEAGEEAHTASNIRLFP
jgi:hypothetical protein